MPVSKVIFIRRMISPFSVFTTIFAFSGDAAFLEAPPLFQIVTMAPDDLF